MESIIVIEHFVLLIIGFLGGILATVSFKFFFDK
jgi:hypothetical protein